MDEVVNFKFVIEFLGQSVEVIQTFDAAELRDAGFEPRCAGCSPLVQQKLDEWVAEQVKPAAYFVK